MLVELTGLLPVFDAPVTDRVWLVAAHGGAGCTTIRHGLPDVYADAGRALPVSVDSARPSRMVLCAMGTGRGLEALQGLLVEWSEGRFGSSLVVGCAVTDPVARMPRELVKGRLQLASVSPRLWRLPFIAGLELSGFPQRYPSAYARMARDLDLVGDGSTRGAGVDRR